MPQRYTGRVLIATHDTRLGRSLEAYLRRRGYTTDCVESGEQACNQLDAYAFEGVVCELGLRNVGGLRLMEIARKRQPDLCAVLLVDESEVERATQAMTQGAHDFQTRPVNLDKLDAVLQRGLSSQRMALEQVALRRRLDERFGLGALTGHSAAMAQVYTAVRQIAPAQTPVLLWGEPGAGKEAIAQALHQHGARRDEVFVKVDCEQLPTAVAAEDLFGVVRGGRSEPGRFELADKGTLYIQNLAALDERLYAALARALREGYIVREGDGRRTAVDVRVIASISEAPERLGGALRHSLLWTTLGAAAIEVPPLRARREDIPMLLGRALGEFNELHRRTVEGFTPQALEHLAAYRWPGNLRELREVVEFSAMQTRDQAAIGVRALPAAIQRAKEDAPAEIRVPLGTTLEEMERVAIDLTMRHCQDNKEACAAMLKIGLRTLYRKLHAYEETPKRG